MLMAKDRTKHLIPCYKNIDAYDMPKEFAKLQAQDMGKVGAMQDLLRGIEKILPKNAPATVIQEKVIVSGGGDSKVTALLDRGNMALEDGDWAKADGFFEEVLNNDSKNAEAYLGKTLAQEQCRSLDALVEKRLAVHEQVEPETLSIPKQTEHINQATEKYILPGYVAASEIRKLYNFDRNYTSEVSGRQEQYHQEEAWWANHRLLSRAEKFADGIVAEDLTAKKKWLFAQLTARVKKAQETDDEKTKELEKAYDAFIAEADQQAQNLYDNGLARREKNYQAWAEQAKSERNPMVLINLAKTFSNLRNYKGSQSLAEYCRKRAEEEQRKADDEKARREAVAKQRQQKAAARKKKLVVAATILVMVLIIAYLLFTNVVVPKQKYSKAMESIQSGDYEEGYKLLEKLNRNDEIKENKYQRAQTFIRDGSYDEAYALLGEIGLEDEISENKHQRAEKLLAEGNYDEAYVLLKEIGMEDEISESKYQRAENLLSSGEIRQAIEAFAALGDYRDAATRCMELWNSISSRNNRGTISAGSLHTVAVKKDGSVVAVGNNEFNQCGVRGWKNIVAVSSDMQYTVGLKKDGTVLAIGYNEDGRCEVFGWKDIVEVSTGACDIYTPKKIGVYVSSGHTVGLKRDGTVVAAGDNEDNQCDVSDWKGIVSISAGAVHTVGLKDDGTVVAVGGNGWGQCDVSDWEDIVAVSAGLYHTVGLKSDGTVVAVGKNTDGQYSGISNWRDIVAISAGYYQTLGLKRDGTVVAAGQNEHGECNVSDWENIVEISAKQISVGLKADGTVVATGGDTYRQSKISEWTDIQLPTN